MNHGFKAACLPPSLGLLMHRRPGRQVVGQQAPRATGLDHVTHRVEQLTQRIEALGGVFAQQRQVRGDERPLLITHVGRMRFAAHAASLPHPKCMTGSNPREIASGMGASMCAASYSPSRVLSRITAQPAAWLSSVAVKVSGWTGFMRWLVGWLAGEDEWS